jgi:hypothetical protein
MYKRERNKSHACRSSPTIQIQHLKLRLRASAGNGALDKTIGVGLRSINLGVLASVLEAFVPREIYKRND